MKTGKRMITMGLATGLLALGVACSQQEMPAGEPTAELPAPTKAIAVLHPANGTAVSGVVSFEQVEGGVMVTAVVEGLTPGKHGFHIHQYGDCSAPDATSAGGHFSPMSHPHGAPTDMERHVGDLGNLEADSTGRAEYKWTDPHLTFSGRNSIIGRGLIVHADEDDLTSQPTGAAGARVACGVIGVDE